MTPKRAAISALTAVVIVVGGTVGAVQATTQSAKKTSCTVKPVKTGNPKDRRVMVVCKGPRTPSATITKTVTATATVTQTVFAMATATTTVTVAPSSSPTASPQSTQTPTQSASPTASSTPTASPTASPSTPPSGFPDGTNTGVPVGTSLTAYTGSCTITSTVTIDAKTLTCPNGVLVRAAGVVIKNSKVNGRIVVDTDVNRTWSLNLTDSEVDAGDGDLPAIYNGNVTIVRANIHGGHNGLECQEHSSFCSLRDSWIHDQWQAASGDTHLGGVLVLGEQVPCTGTNGACAEFVHNNIVCDAPVNSSGGGCTGDINLLPHYGPLPGAIIKDNLLGGNVGSSFCTYGGYGMEYPASHIVYTGNVFQRGSNRKCAAYGPVTNFDSGATGNVWSGNVWDDGTAVAAAN